MKLKKFGQFVNTINENSEFDDDFRLGQDEDTLSNEETISSGETDLAPVAGEEEEPEQGYKGDSALPTLAELLGTEVDKETNSITYEGKKINWFSETEMYQIDNKRFESAEEVVDYLSGQSESEEVQDINHLEKDVEDVEDDIADVEDDLHESFRHIRKFK